MCRDFDEHAVGRFVDMGNYLKIFWMTEPMHIIAAESSDLPSIKILRLRRKKDKLMTKARNSAFGFQITSIEKNLDAVSSSKITFPYLLKRRPHDDVKSNLFHIPARINIGKGLFSKKVGRGREEILFIGF